MKKVYFAYGSRRLESIMVGEAWHASRSRKLADHIFTHTQEAERVSRTGGKSYQHSKSTLHGILPPAKLNLLQVS